THITGWPPGGLVWPEGRPAPSAGLLAGLGEPGELVDPALVRAEHARPHPAAEQPREEPALGLLGHDLPLGAGDVQQPRMVRRRAERAAGPGQPPERLELGDLGGHRGPEGHPGETAAGPELRPRARAVPDAPGVA